MSLTNDVTPLDGGAPTTLTPLPTGPVQPKFHHVAPARPILARDADSLYWMARYVERAEHVARLLVVNANVHTVDARQPRATHRALAVDRSRCR